MSESEPNPSAWRMPDPGSVIAQRYRVVEPLERGGMGVLFRAIDETLTRTVAIKLLRPEAALQRDVALTRFRREARASASVRHPGVVAVLDGGEHKGVPFLVLEYLAGESLAARLRRVAHFAVADAARLGLELCDVLAAVHAAGIVHRDLKPDNVFFSKAASGMEAVRLLDFGIAKLLDDTDQLTRSREMLGSLAYMAPEQIVRARDVTAAADIYALGCVLYEVLGGRRPFRATSDAELTLAVLHDSPPPLRALRADISEQLAAVIARALSKRAAERCSADELAGELRRALESADPAPRTETPAFSGGERYLLEAPLGEGGFGIVYAARDRLTGRKVALKRLHRMRGDDFLRFKREFRIAAAIDLPGIVRPEALVGEGGHWFYVMELIAGEDLGAYVCRFPHALIKCFASLAATVAALHQEGVIHRDLKPSNVLVDRDGRVRVLDFGLAVAEDDTASATAGTRGYLPPEVTLGRRASTAADVYAMGVMLQSALESLEAAQTLDAGMAGALTQLATAMVARDPEERPTAAAVAERLRPLDGSLTVPRRAPADPFVGRAAERRRLDAAMSGFDPTHSRCVLVEGSSGIGKSSLLRSFAGDARRAGGLVLYGRSHPAEVLPFRMIDAAMDELARHLRAYPQISADPEGAEAMARIFPSLAPIELGRAGGGASDPLEVRHRAFGALRSVLQRMSTRLRTVLVLDDLQWIDADSAALVARLFAPPEPPPLLLVAALRTGPRGAACDALIQSLGAATGSEHLVLAPLSDDEAIELVTRLAPSPLSPERARALARAAGGHPYLLRELMSTSVLEVADDSIELSRVLSARIEALPPAVRMLLEMVAICPQPLALRHAHAAVPSAPADSGRVLDTSRLARTLALDGQLRLELFHDRVREVVLSALDHRALRARHQRLLDVLESDGSTPAETMAYHLELLGEGERAARHALHAAERATHALAFERAAELYAIALRHDGAPAAHRIEVLRGRALALGRAGRRAEAGAALLEAAAFEESPARAAALQRLAGEQLLLGGKLREGLAAIAPALERHGLAVASGPEHAVAEALALAGSLLASPLAIAASEASAAAEQFEQLEQLDLCLMLSRCLMHVDLRGLPFALRALSLAQQHGSPDRLLRACALFVMATAGPFPNPLIVPALERCRILASELGEPYGKALLALAELESLHFGGDFLGAEAACERAERILLESCHDVSREIGAARASALVIQHSQKGDFAALAARGLQWLAEAEARDDLFHANWLRAAHALVWVARDEPARARSELMKAEATWPGGAGVFETAVALYLDVIDRYEQAPTALERVAQGRASLLASPLAQSPLLRGYLALHRAWAGLRLLARGDQAQSSAVNAAVDELRALGLASWQATADAYEANLLAHAGDRDAAVGKLDHAERRFRSLHMLALAACAKRRRGELCSGELRNRLVQDADRELTELGVKRPARFAGAYFSLSY